MQNVHGSLKINELKLQGTEGVDFKLKVQADELHIKRGNTSLLTVSMDANSVLTGVTPSGSDKITINAPVKFNKGVSYEDASGEEKELLPMMDMLMPVLMRSIRPKDQALKDKLFKDANYGMFKPYFDATNMTKLLDEGFSGRNVKYAHLENWITDGLVDNNLYRNQEIKTVIPSGTAWEPIYGTEPSDLYAARHPTSVMANTVGFDLVNHIFASSYNCDAHCIPIWHIDTRYDFDEIVDGTLPNSDGYDLWADDDDMVRGFETAYDNNLKVISTAFGVYTDTDQYKLGSSTYWGEYSNRKDGESNPLSLIASMAADNDCVYCSSAGNRAPVRAGVYPTSFEIKDENGIEIGGTAVPYDAKNCLAVGSYDLSTNSNLVPETYNSLGMVPYSSYGTTHDGRVKPDILGVCDENKRWYYGTDELYPISSQKTYMATSPASPFVASGVMLLREARPVLNAHQIRECILMTGSEDTPHSTNWGMGYGIPNFNAAKEYKSGFEAAFDAAKPSIASFTDAEGNVDQVAYDVAVKAANDEAWGSYPVKDEVFTQSLDDIPTVPYPANGSKMQRVNNIQAAPKSWISVKKGQSLDDVVLQLKEKGLKIRTVSKKLHAISVEGDSKEKVEQAIANNVSIGKVRPVSRVRIVLD